MSWPFNRLNLALLAALVCLTIAGFWLLPPDRQLPIHWNWRGVPDVWWPRNHALLITPLLAGAIAIIFWVVERAGIEAIRRGGGRRYTLVVPCVFAALLAVQTIIVLEGLGRSVAPIRAITLVIALVLIAIGNVLPKSVPSGQGYGWPKSLGLLRERRVQKLMGGLMMVAGLVLLIAGLLDLPPPLLVTCTLLGVFVPIVAGIAYAMLRPAGTGNE